MELKDVKLILNRIKSNYPSFVNDDFTRSEWYKELKDYALDDVMKKLEEHFRNEYYGNQIPKVYFLTKYLVKEKDKGDRHINELKCFCSLCHRSVLVVDYQEHYRKCNSIDYIIRQIKKYKNLDVKWKDVEELTDEKFNNLYEKVLNLTLKEGSEREKESIMKYRESVENDRLCNQQIDTTLD